MPRKRTRVILPLALAVLAGGCGTSSSVAADADRGVPHAHLESMHDVKPDSPVHTIAMPHDEPAFPAGPGREAFATACVVCHSPRYIAMQPPFSRTTWLGEVNKMKDAYRGQPAAVASCISATG